jgi:hypothetical protein
MQKTFSMLLCFVLFSLALNAGQIKKTYTIGNYSIESKSNYQTIGFANALITGKVGEPVLPYFAVTLLLPPGEIAESIEFIGEDEIIIPGNFNIYPQQNVQPVSLGSTGTFVRNDQVYSSDMQYPANATGHLSTRFMNGFGIAMSVFTPVQYNPAQGTLKYFQKVTIIIKTKKSETAKESLANISSREEIITEVKEFIQNPESVSDYPKKESKAGEYELLIITPNTYQNSLQNIITLNIQKGIRTKVATTETIYSTITGSDNQMKIRNYIIQEYQNYGIKYVLLGGDVELVPYRGFYCYVQSGSGYEDYGIPADLYYAALDGTWNTNNNNKWGEPDEDDLLPELSIGRMSFSNTTDLNNLMAKTVSYQSSPVLGELARTLLAGEKLMDVPLTYGEDYLELLIGLRNDNGYTTNGIPNTANIDKLYDKNIGGAGWSKAMLLTRLNQGKNFIHHSGHANEDYVMRLYNSDITTTNFSQVNGTTHNYELIYTHGCICGAFDANDCIAEKMTNLANFAVSFVGNSRYGWFNEGFTEGPSAHLHREFVQALYTDSLSFVAEAHKLSKIRTSPWVEAPGQWEPGALRWCFYDNNVIGDPTLSVWTNEPITIQAVYPSTIMANVASFNVNVKKNSTAVRNFRCALVKNNVMYGLGITNASGNAQVVMFQTPPVGVAQLIVSGYNCLPTSYNIDVIPLGINEITADANLLMNIYPNPVSEETMINYFISSETGVKITIYNSFGQVIDKISEIKTQAQGNYTVKYKVTDLSSGLYYCKIETNGKSITKKFSVTK